jgi:hypothetical protein
VARVWTQGRGRLEPSELGREAAENRMTLHDRVVERTLRSVEMSDSV